MVTSPRFIARIKSSRIPKRTVVVECPLWKPEIFGARRQSSSMYAITCFRTSRSNTLERAGNIDTGRKSFSLTGSSIFGLGEIRAVLKSRVFNTSVDDVSQWSSKIFLDQFDKQSEHRESISLLTSPDVILHCVNGCPGCWGSALTSLTRSPPSDTDPSVLSVVVTKWLLSLQDQLVGACD